MKTVVSMKFGSHLYGTSTPESDLDFKAVHIPDAKDILLQRAMGSISDKRNKAEGEKNLAGETDQESYSLQRFFELLVDGQTVAIDMLFAPEEMLLETSDLWKLIQSKRHLLLTNKSAAFVGYCRTQANKYGIKGSRVAAARDAAKLFTETLALRGPQAKVRDIADDLVALVGDHANIIHQKINSVGHIGIFFECCNRKVAFDGTIKQAAEVFERVHASYGQRAQLAQSNEGVDWKALSHAVRVGEEAIELMATGKVTFPLRNAEHILAIKQGHIPYVEVAKEIEELLVTVEAGSSVSILRDAADTEFIDGVVSSVYAGVVKESFTKGNKLKLQVKRGLPASGKTTAAYATVKESGNTGRINRDDLRAMLFESKWTGRREQVVIDCEKAIAKVLFEHKMNAIVDDTNLSSGHVDMWKNQAKEIGFSECNVDTLEINITKCVEADGWRAEKQVGKAIIHRMALNNGFIEWGDKPLVIVDIDGTIACGEHREHYVKGERKSWDLYFSECTGDRPVDFVVRWVRELSKTHTICLVSGRPDTTQFDTIWWLDLHNVPYDYLFMRGGSDKRPDTMVKQDILNKLPKDKIDFALDDRPVVIREVWRKNNVKVYAVRGECDEF